VAAEITDATLEDIEHRAGQSAVALVIDPRQGLSRIHARFRSKRLKALLRRLEIQERLRNSTPHGIDGDLDAQGYGACVDPIGPNQGLVVWGQRIGEELRLERLVAVASDSHPAGFGMIFDFPRDLAERACRIAPGAGHAVKHRSLEEGARRAQQGFDIVGP